MQTNFHVIGEIPVQHPAESIQFERVLSILRECQKEIGPWCVVVLDIPFHHDRGNLIDVDRDWDSQIDMMVMSERRIISYELKGFTARIIYGKTDNRDWVIKRWNSDRTDAVKSFFQQASRGHAFLVRDFLPRYGELHDQLSGNHWIVDTRVVLKPESDLSGFFYRLPRTIFADKFETEVIALIPDESDVALIRRLFSGREDGTGKLRSVRLPEEEYDRAVRVFRENSILPRTVKWFRLLTENQLASDIARTGSDRFRLDLPSALGIADTLKSGA